MATNKNTLRLVGIYHNRPMVGGREVKNPENPGVIRMETPGGQVREVELSLDDLYDLATNALRIAQESRGKRERYL